MKFYQLYKRRGFNETLLTLYSTKNHCCTLPEFFDRLKETKDSYYNAFFRVKADLKEFGLIEYRRNRNKEKTIRLTSKGVKIVRVLKEINRILDPNVKSELEIAHKEEHVKQLITP